MNLDQHQPKNIMDYLENIMTWLDNNLCKSCAVMVMFIATCLYFSIIAISLHFLVEIIK
jgi:hypothetical protein